MKAELHKKKRKALFLLSVFLLMIGHNLIPHHYHDLGFNEHAKGIHCHSKDTNTFDCTFCFCDITLSLSPEKEAHTAHFHDTFFNKAAKKENVKQGSIPVFVLNIVANKKEIKKTIQYFTSDKILFKKIYLSIKALRAPPVLR